MSRTQNLSPEDIIQMALGSNADLLKRKLTQENEENLYRSARRSNIVRPRVTPDEDEAPVPGGPAATEPISSAPMAGNDVQKLAQSLAASQYGWSGPEWDALYDLVQKESSWNPYAANPNSSARGLFQFVKGTGRSYGLGDDASKAPVEKQIRAGLKYIADRYKTPSGALKHWQSRVPLNGKDVGNWY